MKQYNLKTRYKKILADTLTPVSVYLKIRDRFPNSLLLESSDYHANDNSFSYICCDPIAHFTLKEDQVVQKFPDGQLNNQVLGSQDLMELLRDFAQRFQTEDLGFAFAHNGLFGYMTYDTVQHFERVSIKKKDEQTDIPEMHYAVYSKIIAINHFKNEAYLFSHQLDEADHLTELQQLLNNRNFASYRFERVDDKVCNLSDEEYKALVEKAKGHCARGDVFQLVLSRRFQQAFKGDEFNVYRALRSINPSPYLFYFDYTDFKILGSSPEAQLVVKNGIAEIHPIAGTYKRTGNDQKDAELALQLAQDEKENSEHVMLVDLARNDLSRNGHAVEVNTYREVQYFSHVIHLVSKVTGTKNEDSHTLQLVADTFPAGTLSGAPKPMALELIERYEPTQRGYYGGAIGFMDFNGNFNHAIMIRTFLSKNQNLYFQAGAGLVAASDPESELQETYNKLGALQKALEIAEEL
jgi:anthranilate synthase component 1